ncbi:MAG: oxaloacetate decarboxylase [Acidobacteria bacterium]|nr:oxaloacetate decarboxylase [Acidobacteriota bacterium]
MPGDTRIHRLLAEHGTIIMPGVYDALSARIAARAGFEVLFISGYSLSASQLGLPDFGYLTQTELIQSVQRICRATERPIIVDADTGYGNPLNVLRTVEELIRAGAAGMFLEDQRWPKRCGHMRGKRVIPMEDHVQKIRAAVDAREGSDFFIVARTDARQVAGLDEAIRRSHAYKEAGADALFIEAPTSVEELRTMAKELEPPLVANMLEGGVTPLLNREELGEIGLQLIVCPLTALYASARATADILEHLRSAGTTREQIGSLLEFEKFNSIIDLDAHYSLENRYSAAKEPEHG